jgi:alkylation response protein AidB-like acyl-CoA dehydrogenase
MSDFYQDSPRLGNQYTSDALLRSYLKHRLPAEALEAVEPDLQRFGERVATEILALGNVAESDPPQHVPYDAWGRRIDDIVVSDAWRALDRVSAEEGLVAIGYERRFGASSRIYQMAKLYLFHASSATYSCPLAMGDGAARFLEVFGEGNAAARNAFEHLTSRDPEKFWTSGQWMTERTGGSDVSATSTVARRSEEGFRLSGTKWFTSATTSQMAMALARIEGAPAGGRGLSVFLIELRDADGALRGIRVNRLKDKLGTRALPTAELTLDDTPATLIGGEGDGVRKISALFNVTRVYNAVAAVSGMRRAVALATDYASRRVAFGKPLIDQPLHAETLADLETRVRAAFLLVFRVVELMGKEECGEATDAERAIMRLLIPVAKLYTAKEAVAVASEALEAFGGAGYIEDTGLPRLLRDAQVLPIWEGTTNVLSLDMWRAIERTDAFAPWLDDVRRRLSNVSHQSAIQVSEAADRIAAHVAATQDAAARQAGARRLAFAIARVSAAVELIEIAESQHADTEALAVATRWVENWFGARSLG